MSESNNPILLRQAWDFLSMEDKVEHADVIWIMGGSSLLPVTRASELYKQGFAPKIAFISKGGTFGGKTI